MRDASFDEKRQRADEKRRCSMESDDAFALHECVATALSVAIKGSTSDDLISSYETSWRADVLVERF